MRFLEMPNVDLVLVIGSTLLSGIMGYLGVTVSLDRNSHFKVKRYTSSFILLAIAMICLNAYQTYRNQQSAQKASEAQARMEKSMRELRENPIVVTTKLPPQPSNVYFQEAQTGLTSKVTGAPVWVDPGDEMILNFHYAARGPADATDFRGGGTIIGVPSLKDPYVRESYDELKAFVKTLPHADAPLVAGSSDRWFSARTDVPIGQDHFDRMVKGDEMIVVLQDVLYSDPVGDHEIENCKILIPEPEHTPFNAVAWAECGMYTHRH